jgi:hypothetical protein
VRDGPGRFVGRGKGGIGKDPVEKVAFESAIHLLNHKVPVPVFWFDACKSY